MDLQASFSGHVFAQWERNVNIAKNYSQLGASDTKQVSMGHIYFLLNIILLYVLFGLMRQ